MRVNDVAFALACDAHQRKGVAQDRDRIVAAHVERDEFGAGGGHVGDQASGARHHDSAVSGPAENARERCGAGIGGADVERRNDNQAR